MKPPSFQFYARDFLEGTAHFSAEECGAYIRLLSHQWVRGTLPKEIKQLARMGGISSKKLSKIQKLFK